MTIDTRQPRCCLTSEYVGTESRPDGTTVAYGVATCDRPGCCRRGAPILIASILSFPGGRRPQGKAMDDAGKYGVVQTTRELKNGCLAQQGNNN